MHEPPRGGEEVGPLGNVDAVVLDVLVCRVREAHGREDPPPQRLFDDRVDIRQAFPIFEGRQAVGTDNTVYFRLCCSLDIREEYHGCSERCERHNGCISASSIECRRGRDNGFLVLTPQTRDTLFLALLDEPGDIGLPIAGPRHLAPHELVRDAAHRLVGPPKCFRRRFELEAWESLWDMPQEWKDIDRPRHGHCSKRELADHSIYQSNEDVRFVPIDGVSVGHFQYGGAGGTILDCYTLVH